MLDPVTRDTLDRCNDWPANQMQLGKLMHRTTSVVKGSYSFARDGGAVGYITLKDQDGVTPLTIPSGALILNSLVYVTTAVLSGGAATVGVGLEADNDIFNATAKASLSIGAKIVGIPDYATAADYLKLTADRSFRLKVGTAALTAGVLDYYVWYVL
jgi:hypothetical protein